MTIEQALTLLAQKPPRIGAMTAGLVRAQLHTALSAGEWSANDALAHLRSCADVWGRCIAEIIARDKPTLRAIDPRTWIKQTDYLDQEFLPSLGAFATQRTDLLAVLEALTPEDWSRSATLTGAGKPLQRTVVSYTQRMARHEWPHVKQIQRIVSTLRG
jgi:hypothetical protein